MVRVNDLHVKTLLQAYRVGTDDESAPIFRAALEKAASDPELAAWFRAQQEFDAVMTRTFSEVPVDSTVKERILNALQSAAEEPNLPKP